MNSFNRTNNHKTTTTTTWVNQGYHTLSSNNQYIQNQNPQRVYNTPTQYQRGRSTSYNPTNRRVNSVTSNKQNGNVIKNTYAYNITPQTKVGNTNLVTLDHMNKNLQKYSQGIQQKDNNNYNAPNTQRPVSIRSGHNQNRRQNPSIPKQVKNYRNPSTHSRKEYKSPINMNILQKTISRSGKEKFVSNPTQVNYLEKKNIGQEKQTIGMTISERNNNTEIYTSKIKTSQLIDGVMNGGNKSGYGNQDFQVSNYPEQDIKYQSIHPDSNYFKNTKDNNFVRENNQQSSIQRGRNRKSKSSRNDSSGRMQGNAFINIPKVQTNYGIMKKSPKNNIPTYKKRNEQYYNGGDNNQRGRKQPDPYFKNKMQNSNEMLSGYNSAEKGIKMQDLNEYEKAVNKIDSKKLFKNNFQIDNRNKLKLEDNIFNPSNNYMNSVKSREKSRNASRSRSRLQNMELLGRSVDKGNQKFNRSKPKLDPFSYKFNISSQRDTGKIEQKNNSNNVNQMMEKANKYGDTAITFDPIIERKVRALPKDKVKKALFNTTNIKSTDELKEKILKKNEILMKLKAQHLKLLQDPKNPDNLRSQLEMREKQNNKILEKIRKIKEQTEEKKEEYKELIEIDNQMKSLLGMMSESEKRERDRLIAELKRTDALYLKTKQENEELKAQMEDSSKGMVFKQHLIDEEVNRVKTMIEDQLEDDFEKGNQMLINQIQKMYNKLLAAKN